MTGTPQPCPYPPGGTAQKQVLVTFLARNFIPWQPLNSLSMQTVSACLSPPAPEYLGVVHGHDATGVFPNAGNGVKHLGELFLFILAGFAWLGFVKLIY